MMAAQLAHWEFRLAGSGGQGLITAGIILAEAAVASGLNAVQTQSYGPESRGGASRAEVIISSGEIDYPKVIRPDVLLVMTQQGADRYLPGLKDSGLLVADEDLVKDIPPASFRVVRAPIVRLAREEVGREIVANIVALGVLVSLTEVVPVDILEEAVLKRVPRGTEDLNRRALRAGLGRGK